MRLRWMLAVFFSTLLWVFLAGCDLRDFEYCSYEVGWYEECDIDEYNAAPEVREGDCGEFLAACDPGGVAGVEDDPKCVVIESGLSICTRWCDEDLDCPIATGGVCVDSLCVPG